ncbi:MAG: hypothetical protein JXB15_10580 [Anaerolineales bacterium]|nr:hypothetical protein [Anaerolineales bacterium]
MKPRRPLILTLLALGVLLIAGINLARLQQAVVRWQFLDDLLPVSPLYLALGGLVWGLAGLTLAAGLWLRKTWAQRILLPMALAYSLYYWLDRLVFRNAIDHQVGWPFSLGLNLLILAICAWVSMKAQLFYARVSHGGTHGQSENPEIA